MIVRNFDQVTTVVLCHLAVRGVALYPFLLSVAFGKKLPLWIGLSASAVIYCALVIPLRFWGREKFRRLFYSRHHTQKRKPPYERWLKTGLLRYLRGLLWGLPFLAGAVYFTVFSQRLDYKTFWMPVRALAVLVGRENDTSAGALVALMLMALFGALFAYGWFRDMPVEYLPVRSLGTRESLHWARRIMKNFRPRVIKNAVVNTLLSLPALIGAGVVLAPYVKEKVDFSLSPELMAKMLLRLAEDKVPNKVVIGLAVVALVLYLPLCVYRKMRNAALVAYLMKSHVHDIHRSQEAAPAVEPKPVNRDAASREATAAVAPKIVNLEGTPLDAPQESHEA